MPVSNLRFLWDKKMYSRFFFKRDKRLRQCLKLSRGGATTLSITTLGMSTLSISTLGIMKLGTMTLTYIYGMTILG
jgi:hypothetical protein